VGTFTGRQERLSDAKPHLLQQAKAARLNEVNDGGWRKVAGPHAIRELLSVTERGHRSWCRQRGWWLSSVSLPTLRFKSAEDPESGETLNRCHGGARRPLQGCYVPYKSLPSYSSVLSTKYLRLCGANHRTGATAWLPFHRKQTRLWKQETRAGLPRNLAQT